MTTASANQCEAAKERPRNPRINLSKQDENVAFDYEIPIWNLKVPVVLSKLLAFHYTRKDSRPFRSVFGRHSELAEALPAVTLKARI